MGIEPTSEAWEAYFKARKRANWRHFCVFRSSSKWIPIGAVSEDSMLPRSGERGNAGRTQDQTPFMRLQWGRAQVSPEMKEHDNWIWDPQKLQWGRAQVSAEITPVKNVWCSARWLQWGHARMSAEIAWAKANQTGWVQLQWGRARMSAEIAFFLGFGAVIVGLQWGRAQASAKIRRGQGQPFRCLHASMGPRSDERGNAAAFRSATSMAWCFNGAALG